MVLFASYSGVLGGAERVLLDCAARLARPVLVACPAGPLAVAVREAGLEHAPLATGTLRLAPAHAAALVAMARELRRFRPLALVAWGARAILAAALLPRAARPPLLAVNHDLLGGPVRAAVRAATLRADAAAAASHAIAAQFGGAVLHPGVDLTAFAPAPPPPGPPHALVLGALVAWKRPDLALEIAAQVPELRLTLAGARLPGRTMHRMDAKIDQALRRPDLAGRVTLPGPLDARDALASAHLLLHCADAEPYGLALVEALAAGRPVVAPAAAGPLEIVTDGAGRLYPPGDARAAAAAIRAVLADPAAGVAARRRAEAEFDVEASSRRFAAVLEATL